MPGPANSTSLIALFRVVIQAPPKLLTPVRSSPFTSIEVRTRPAAIAERFPSVGPAGGGAHVTVPRRYRVGVTRMGKDCRERAGVPR